MTRTIRWKALLAARSPREVSASMSWLFRHRVREFLRTSFWFEPVAAVFLGALATHVISLFEDQATWRWRDYSPEGARSILGVLAGATLTYLGFSISSLLLVAQIASAQLTPRIIPFALGWRFVRASVCLFVFTFVVVSGAIGRIGDRVHQFQVFFAVALFLVSTMVFLWFAYRLAMGMRPVSVLRDVADRAETVIREMYAEPFDPATPEFAGPAAPAEGEGVVLRHMGKAGVIQAFGARDLALAAEQAGGRLEVVPMVGDFVSPGDPLFRFHGGGTPPTAEDLETMVSIGIGRTLAQDPRFALRILADIGCRALSAAVNDPTTAVHALDQIQRLLRWLGERRLDAGRVLDREGGIRLSYRTPPWEALVALGLSEIRAYGAASLQVTRRLHALLHYLMENLPPARGPALRRQLELVHASALRAFPVEADLHSAETDDRQGLG